MKIEEIKDIKKISMPSDTIKYIIEKLEKYIIWDYNKITGELIIMKRPNLYTDVLAGLGEERGNKMYKEKISKIVEKYKEDTEVIDMINDTLNSFGKYVDTVNELESCISVLRFRLDPEDYRERVQNLDTNRRIIHNSVIFGVKFLNRISEQQKLPKFYEGDVADHIQIGDFAMEVVREVFKERKK